MSNTPFLPRTAGNRERIASMINVLRAAGWDIRFLLVEDEDTSDWDLDGMERMLEGFEVVPPPLLARLLRRIRPLHPPPRGIDDWCPRWLRRRVATITREWRPDVVLVEYVFLSACLAAIDGGSRRPLTVLDTHDLMHKRADAYAAVGLAPQWFHTSQEEERRGLARADVVLAIQDDDARVLRGMVPATTEVLVVPHGTMVRPAPLADAAPARVLFVASYNDLNVKALEWVFREAWPVVRARAPQAELVVCGRIRAKLGALPAGVTARGVVEHLAPEYDLASVVLSPVRGGTGLKVKAVEALAYGRPVVSTSMGVTGLDVGLDSGVLVADDGPAFAAAIVELLTDRVAWARAAAGAAAQAARRFSLQAAFSGLLDRLAATRGR